MVGYGFLNSKMQELCVKGIITSFFERSSFFLYFYYNFILERKISKPKIFNIYINAEIDKIFKIFILEEKYIEENGPNGKAAESSNSESFGFNKNYLKYILSSNIIKNQNYNFDSKNVDDVIADGNKNFRTIFLETFIEFLSRLTSEDQPQENTINIIIKNLRNNIIKYPGGYGENTGKSLGKYFDPTIGNGLPTSEIDKLFISILINEEAYTKNLSSLIDFYKKNGLLNLRDSLLSILTGQINALEQ